jgi:hypothetical protein
VAPGGLATCHHQRRAPRCRRRSKTHSPSTPTPTTAATAKTITPNTRRSRHPRPRAARPDGDLASPPFSHTALRASAPGAPGPPAHGHASRGCACGSCGLPARWRDRAGADLDADHRRSLAEARSGGRPRTVSPPSLTRARRRRSLPSSRKTVLVSVGRPRDEGVPHHPPLPSAPAWRYATNSVTAGGRSNRVS